MSERTSEQVQQPQETRWEWQYDVLDERNAEANRQKGFKNAERMTVKKSGWKANKVRQETDVDMQWDTPREEY